MRSTEKNSEALCFREYRVAIDLTTVLGALALILFQFSYPDLLTVCGGLSFFVKLHTE